jgi:transposase
MKTRAIRNRCQILTREASRPRRRDAEQELSDRFKFTLRGGLSQSKADEVDGSRSQHLIAMMGLLSCNPSKEPPAMEIITIGLDLAKNVFQVHGIRAIGDVVIRKALRRSQMLPFFERLPLRLVGAEACGTSHRWARELTKLGHEVRLMPAAYVKPYVKRGKNDAADAEAICEAVTRQTMRFVPIKSREQQAALSLHRLRSLLIKQRTQLVNMMRSVLAALGIAIPVGIVKALQMARKIVDGESELELPAEAAHVASMLAGQLLQLHVPVAQARPAGPTDLADYRQRQRDRRLAQGSGSGAATAVQLPAGPAQQLWRRGERRRRGFQHHLSPDRRGNQRRYAHHADIALRAGRRTGQLRRHALQSVEAGL